MGLLILLASVIYPAPPSGISFDHRQHTAEGCEACHQQAAASVRARDRLLPAEAVCFRCHDPTGGSELPAACDTCHPGYRPASLPPLAGRRATWRAAPPPPGPPPSPPAALRFSHRAHRPRASCVECHGEADRVRLPSMERCGACHDGDQASSRCATCHLSGPDGRLRTELPGGRLVPRSGSFGDSNHDAADFARQGHGRAAKVDSASCRGCHDEAKDCLRCHAGVVRPVELHPADYLVLHAQDARRNQPDCKSCHRLQSFCLDCHARSGVTGAPALRFGHDGRLGATFHPPGYTTVPGGLAGPAHHKFDARRNLRACVSCHQESSCVACHSAGATFRLRASPHPPGFRARCATLRRRNDRPCRTCHGSPADLDRICR